MAKLLLPSALLLALAGALYAVAMGPMLFAWLLYGPVCSGHGSAFAPHCAPCYAAAALVVAALMAPLAHITRARGSATLP